MRRFLSISLTLALGLSALVAVPAVAQSDNARPNVGDQEAVTAGVYTADGVATWEVSIPRGSDGDGRNGRLTVDTKDCCLSTDIWRVRIIKHNGQVMAEGVGDGSQDEFTGAATIPALPRKGVLVEVSWVEGIDVFPAGFDVRFQFSGEDIEITQTAGFPL